jgi:hypothetical protein
MAVAVALIRQEVRARDNARDDATMCGNAISRQMHAIDADADDGIERGAVTIRH